MQIVQAKKNESFVCITVMSQQKRLFDKIWQIFSFSETDKNILKDEESRKMIYRLYEITSQAEPDYSRIWKKIQYRIVAVKRRRIIFYSGAACVVLFITLSLFIHYGIFQSFPEQSIIFVQESLPKGITLTLPDGEVVGLEKQGAGDIFRSEEILSKQIKENDLKSSESAATSKELKYNIIDVPVAAEYRLILSDGTKVCLNSSSRLKYPVGFAADERRIFLEGEAYFEVMKDKKRPFRVEVEGTVVEALGTAFNINAYMGTTNIQTTLVQGKVEVGNSQGKVILEPGQQAICSEGRITVQEVNCRDFIAWKDGLFVFSRMKLSDIMVQMERWYDLETVFVNPEIRDYTFTGMIDRNLSPEEIFRIIEKTVTVHFKRQNKTVIIN